MAIEKIGVVGCGLMGAGIAQTCAAAGYATVVREVSEPLLEKGIGGISKRLQRLVDKERISSADKAAIEDRLTPTTELAKLSDCDLIIEAVTEDFDVKREIFSDLGGSCRPDAVFASNTSSLSITQLMTTTERPERFIGLHFFNPVPIMKLVEVVRTMATDDQVMDQAIEFAESLGKHPVRCEDHTGFLVNRLLVPYLLDAVRALEAGTGTLEDIDQAMKLGCGYPMGPFTLLDFVGLDTTYHIANIMFDEFREQRFAPPPLLKRMVLAGRYGRKSGRGFYDYS